MSSQQPGILEPVPQHARYLYFQLTPGADPRAALKRLAASSGAHRTVGLGQSLLNALGAVVNGLREMPALAGVGVGTASTPTALWIWLWGNDPGHVLVASREVIDLLGDSFELERSVPAFKYDSGRDLSGYEDGTENPHGDKALAAAVLRDAGAGLDGSSFVAVQHWLHSAERLRNIPEETMDLVIGRRVSDNEEIGDAPPFAHTKRAAQESFDPEAFMVRRSMPWLEGSQEGLVFVAFGRSFDAFEAVLTRMLGLEDGVTDGLFRFTRPTSGSYFWCPPLKADRLDLSALGLG